MTELNFTNLIEKTNPANLMLSVTDVCTGNHAKVTIKDLILWIKEESIEYEDTSDWGFDENGYPNCFEYGALDNKPYLLYTPAILRQKNKMLKNIDWNIFDFKSPNIKVRDIACITSDLVITESFGKKGTDYIIGARYMDVVARTHTGEEGRISTLRAEKGKEIFNLYFEDLRDYKKQENKNND